MKTWNRIILLKLSTDNMLPKKLGELLLYSDRYEITVQFWPQQISIYIEKDGVDLKDYGGDFDFAVSRAIEYLNRINNKS